MVGRHRGAAAGLLRAPVRAGGPGPAGLRDRARDPGGPGRGHADRGRGVRRPGRSRLARVPRPDRPQRGDVRPARPRLRVLHLRHALLHEPGLPAGARRIGGAAARRAGHRRGAAGHGPAGPAPLAGRPARGRPGPRPGPALRGAVCRPLARRRGRIRSRLAAAGPGRAGARARGQHQPRPPGRRQPRRGRGLAVLDHRRAHRLALPGVRPAAHPAETGYRSGPASGTIPP